MGCTMSVWIMLVGVGSQVAIDRSWFRTVASWLNSDPANVALIAFVSRDRSGLQRWVGGIAHGGWGNLGECVGGKWGVKVFRWR